MPFKLIVAIDNDNGIGKNNTIPWKCKEDMKLFYKKTKNNNNNAVVMGRKTWNSLKNKPLKDRDNYILSRSDIIIPNEFQKNTFSFTNFNDLIKACNKKNYDETWVIGGSEIYNLFLNENLINELYITRINGSFECDTFFAFDKNKFYFKEKKTLTNQNSDCHAELNIFVNQNKDYQ